jgi:hypothetical protein
MKATIKFDFANLFLYMSDIDNEDLIDVQWDNLYEMNKGDEVEILKVFDTDEFSGGKGYVIYNPKTFQSCTVAYHVLDIIEP